MLIALLLAAQQPPVRIEPGEYRWVNLTVHQTPTEIDCRYDVVSGRPTVHVELLPMPEFRLFVRGLTHGSLASTKDSLSGSIHNVVDESGQYAVVVVNEKGAPPAMVSLDVRTDVNPAPRTLARELPAKRRLAVILISFALFFVTVTWAALKLARAMRSS